MSSLAQPVARPGSPLLAPAPLTVVVLTFNEEQNLPHCLASLAGWAPHVVIVDSGSSDATVDIARQFGAHVLSHPFETHARQWRWALENLPTTLPTPDTEWILGLDADQQVTPELARELARLLAGTRPITPHGFYLKRRQVFRGRWIRFGGYYPKYLLKLFRRSKVRLDANDLVDHHFYVDGPLENLRHDLIEHNRKEDDISFWLEKHCRYARLLASEEFRRSRHLDAAPPLLRPALFGSHDQRVLWMKGLWSALPLYFRSLAYFVYRYLFRLGFLDGKQGFIFHFLQGLWFRLLVDIHLDQLRANARKNQP